VTGSNEFRFSWKGLSDRDTEKKMVFFPLETGGFSTCVLVVLWLFPSINPISDPTNLLRSRLSRRTPDHVKYGDFKAFVSALQERVWRGTLGGKNDFFGFFRKLTSFCDFFFFASLWQPSVTCDIHEIFRAFEHL
jgi:hypothetical protein